MHYKLKGLVKVNGRYKWVEYKSINLGSIKKPSKIKEILLEVE